MKLATRSPEGVSFHLNLAGPVSRLLAWIIDVSVVQALMAMLYNTMMPLFLLDASHGFALYVVASFVGTFGYGIFLEWFWKGQTLGKKALKLQVMDESGLPLSFSQVFLRNLLRVVDSLPLCYFVGGVAMFMSRKRQRLGDLAARTIVTRHVELPRIDFKQANKVKYNSMKGDLRCCARLRQRISPEHAGLTLQSLMRRDQLTDESRLELYAHLRAYVEERVAFPEAHTFGISDEQFVRNTVEILFEQRLERVANEEGDSTDLSLRSD